MCLLGTQSSNFAIHASDFGVSAVVTAMMALAVMMHTLMMVAVMTSVMSMAVGVMTMAMTMMMRPMAMTVMMPMMMRSMAIVMTMMMRSMAMAMVMTTMVMVMDGTLQLTFTKRELLDLLSNVLFLLWSRGGSFLGAQSSELAIEMSKFRFSALMVMTTLQSMTLCSQSMNAFGEMLFLLRGLSSSLFSMERSNFTIDASNFCFSATFTCSAFAAETSLQLRVAVTTNRLAD